MESPQTLAGCLLSLFNICILGQFSHLSVFEIRKLLLNSRISSKSVFYMFLVKHSVMVRMTFYSFLRSDILLFLGSFSYYQILANLCQFSLPFYCRMLTNNSGLLYFENHTSIVTGNSLTQKPNRFFRIRGESMSNVQNGSQRDIGVWDHFLL